MDRKCPNCGYADKGDHWNPASQLPPVHIPFIILKEGAEITVLRREYATDKNDQLEYISVFDDRNCTGRYPWRHA